MIDFAARVKQGFAKAGIGLTSISNTLPYRRQRFLRDLGVSVVLDVGANIGQSMPRNLESTGMRAV